MAEEKYSKKRIFCIRATPEEKYVPLGPGGPVPGGGGGGGVPPGLFGSFCCTHCLARAAQSTGNNEPRQNQDLKNIERMHCEVSYLQENKQ